MRAAIVAHTLCEREAGVRGNGEPGGSEEIGIAT
jgi:hypothetical protein